MPQPGTETDPVVIQHEPETGPQQPDVPVVEVDLSTKPSEAEEQKAAAAQEEAKARAIRNQAEAAHRVTAERDRLRREVEQLRQQVAQQHPSPAAVPVDELDQLVEQGKWKEAVAKVSNQQIEEVLRQREAVQQQQFEVETRTKVLEQSKLNVIAKYPELDSASGDPDSAVSRAYIQVLNEDPRLLADPYGPEVAMARMERKLSQSNPDVARETTRRARAGQASLSPSRPNVKSNVVTLTKDQKDFCEQNNISLEQYARTLRSMEQTGDVAL